MYALAHARAYTHARLHTHAHAHTHTHTEMHACEDPPRPQGLLLRPSVAGSVLRFPCRCCLPPRTIPMHTNTYMHVHMLISSRAIRLHSCSVHSKQILCTQVHASSQICAHAHPSSLLCAPLLVEACPFLGSSFCNARPAASGLVLLAVLADAKCTCACAYSGAHAHGLDG